MVIFRLVEKLGINNRIGNGWIQYIVTVVIVLIGSIVFAVIMQKIIELLRKIINSKIIKMRTN